MTMKLVLIIIASAGVGFGCGGSTESPSSGETAIITSLPTVNTGQYQVAVAPQTNEGRVRAIAVQNGYLTALQPLPSITDWDTRDVRAYVLHEAAYDRSNSRYFDWYARDGKYMLSVPSSLACMIGGRSRNSLNRDNQNNSPTLPSIDLACPPTTRVSYSSPLVPDSLDLLSVASGNATGMRDLFGKQCANESRTFLVRGLLPEAMLSEYSPVYLHLTQFMAEPQPYSFQPFAKSYYIKTAYPSNFLDETRQLWLTQLRDPEDNNWPPKRADWDLGYEGVLSMRNRTTSNKVIYPAGSDFVIASLGDSYAAGEGLPNIQGRFGDTTGPIVDFLTSTLDFILNAPVVGQLLEVDVSQTIDRAACTLGNWNQLVAPVWTNNSDHMSYVNTTRMALARFENERRDVRFRYFNFAKSGARALDIVDNLGPGGNQFNRLVQQVGNRKIDALVLNAGGNDIGFADVLEASGSLSSEQKNIAYNVSRAGLLGIALANGGVPSATEIDRRLSILVQNLRRLKARIDVELNVERVYLMEYPAGIFSVPEQDLPLIGKIGPDAAGCDIFETLSILNIAGLRVSKSEASAMRRAGVQLNTALKNFAAEAGWIYVDGISAAFESHGYCAPQPYFVKFDESCVSQGDMKGTMHPNRKGIAATSEQLYKAMLPFVPLR